MGRPSRDTEQEDGRRRDNAATSAMDLLDRPVAINVQRGVEQSAGEWDQRNRRHTSLPIGVICRCF